MMTDILDRMQVVDQHNFDLEYEKSQTTAPRVDLDKHELKMLHKNAYTEMGCLKIVE